MLASSDGGGFIQFLLIAGFIIFGLMSGRRKNRAKATPPAPIPSPRPRPRPVAPRRKHDDLDSVMVYDRLSPGDAKEDPRWLAGLTVESTPRDAAARDQPEPSAAPSPDVSEGSTPSPRAAPSLTRADARRAMLWHEIFEPPVALRR